ncbi:MAG: hypothetical protein HXN12_00030 [Porphyromonadaceae bacterium]|nr:hypothetical protein [Porphyromonadaceae bacterium]
MFLDWVDGDSFNLNELSEDIFREQFGSNSIEGYQRSKDSETDAENAWAYWDDNDLLYDFLENLFESIGFVEWDDKPSDGRFIWIQDYEMLAIKPSECELPTDVAATFDRDSLYECQYAQGVVRDGVFYCTVVARELD